jgi:signal transduction histidine kinase
MNDIFDYNKIQQTDVSVSRNTFILQDLVGELETLFSGSMSKEGVKFVVDTSGVDKSAFGDGSKLVLLGDDRKIRRIAINMLSNVLRRVLFYARFLIL